MKEASSSRRSFLKQLGTALAVGVGLAVVPVSQAVAAGTHCCRDSTCPTCPGSAVKYRCSTSCPGGPTGCHCYQPNGTCFDTGC